MLQINYAQVAETSLRNWQPSARQEIIWNLWNSNVHYSVQKNRHWSSALLKKNTDIFIKVTDILDSQIQELSTTKYIYSVKTWIDSLVSHLLEDINFLEPGWTRFTCYLSISIKLYKTYYTKILTKTVWNITDSRVWWEQQIALSQLLQFEIYAKTY
jgi:hypothetical protein